MAPLIQDSLDYYEGVQEIIRLENREVVCVVQNNFICIYSGEGQLSRVLKVGLNKYTTSHSNGLNLLAFSGEDSLMQVLSLDNDCLVYSRSNVGAIDFKTKSLCYFYDNIDMSIYFIDFNDFIVDDCYGYNQSLKVQHLLTIEEPFEASKMKWNKNKTLLAIFSKKVN
jgi:hypothetical protein